MPPGCGNGQLDPGELCDDTAPGNECACEGVRSSEDACVMGKIVAGSPKACNVVCDFVDARDQYGVGHCDDGDPCTQDILAGDPDSCDIECTHLPQDCPAVCGDGIVDEEEGETCDDGPGSTRPCPTSVNECDDGDPCTDDLLLGSASQCNAVCVNSERKEGYGYDTCDDGDPCTEDIVLAHSPETCSIQCDHKTISGYEITHCDDGDACTIDTIRSGDPSTCTSIQCEHENVENCGAACHDGEVQPEYGEYCDDGPGSPTPCPKSVDDCVADNACTRFNLIGSHEKSLAYLLFDLAACVSNGGPPAPPACVPLGIETCGQDECGLRSDGCGGLIDCGGCEGGAHCSSAGICVEGCTERTCASAGYECGLHSDGCAGVIDCGTCDGNARCGLAAPGKCAECMPLTCASAEVECGELDNGCGGILDCGSCGPGRYCGIGNRCEEGASCVPKTCESAGAQCGLLYDGCGGVIQCGTCPAPQVCGYPVANQCGSVG